MTIFVKIVDQPIRHTTVISLPKNEKFSPGFYGFVSSARVLAGITTPALPPFLF